MMHIKDLSISTVEPIQILISSFGTLTAMVVWKVLNQKKFVEMHLLKCLDPVCFLLVSESNLKVIWHLIRADICIFANKMKLVIELKRDYHSEVWTAVERQLDRFYTRDPEANGFGIYGVFWFGEKRKQNIPFPPKGISRPKSADALGGRTYK